MDSQRPELHVDDPTEAASPSVEVAVVRPEGELDAADLRAVGRHCLRLTLEGRRHVVLDLEGVGHLDYRGVPSLVAARQALRREGGDLKLAGVTPYVAAILRAAGVAAEFELHPDVDAAEAAFLQRVG